MSTFIDQQDLNEFEVMEEEWLCDEGSFDEFWNKKLEDENLLFEWIRERFEKTATHFSRVSSLQGVFYTKLMDMLQEAAMTGFFFGELRWNKDIRQMLDSPLVVSGEV